MGEQRAAHAAPTAVGLHVEVLEIEAAAAGEGREVVEEEREADRLLVLPRDHRLGPRPRPEQLVAKNGFRGHDGVREPLVLGQLPDEAQDERDVVGGRRRDAQHQDRIIAREGVRGGAHAPACAPPPLRNGDGYGVAASASASAALKTSPEFQ